MEEMFIRKFSSPSDHTVGRLTFLLQEIIFCIVFHLVLQGNHQVDLEIRAN